VSVYFVYIHDVSYSLLQTVADGSELFRASATDIDFNQASIVSYKIDEVCSLPWHKLHPHSHILH